VWFSGTSRRRGPAFGGRTCRADRLGHERSRAWRGDAGLDGRACVRCRTRVARGPFRAVVQPPIGFTLHLLQGGRQLSTEDAQQPAKLLIPPNESPCKEPPLIPLPSNKELGEPHPSNKELGEPHRNQENVMILIVHLLVRIKASLNKAFHYTVSHTPHHA
jgi:hypothetical protein